MQPAASRRDVDGCTSLVAVFSDSIYSVQQTQKYGHPNGVSIFLLSQQGFEEAGPCAAGVKNMPVACFLGRGRIHRLMNAPGTGVGISLLFVTEELDRATSKVYTNNKRNAALGGLT